MNSPSNVRFPVSLSVVLVGAMCVLLPILAFLQYRWIGAVSDLERDRLREGLDTATRRFVEDLNREFANVATTFQLHYDGSTLGLEGQLSRSVEHWHRTAPFPNIIKAVHVASEELDGAWVLRRFDSESELLKWAPWPEELNRVSMNSLLADTATPFASSESVWLVSAITSGQVFSRGRVPRPPVGWLLVELNTSALSRELLPEIVQRHFDARAYTVAVVSSPGSKEMLFASDTAISREDLASPDASIGAFGPPSPLRARVADSRPPGVGLLPKRPVPVPVARSRVEAALPNLPFGRTPFTVIGARWQLVAQHRLGSLEAAVSAVRRRNLFVGLGTLSLLGFAGVMTVVWAERVRSIGRLQMELAAGISHELRTPLATIRTAAHNIASGVVTKPGEVREYGGMLQAQSRRLSTMVDQVLHFAQIESRRRGYDLRPISLHQVVEHALGVVLPTGEAAARRVQTDIDSDLAEALGDETALTHALGNLISNAFKYGSAEGLVRINGQYDRRSSQLRLSVSNDGSGIDPSDLPHIFEPFYRGRNVAGTAGSGLGLSLVRKMIEGQGGKVIVDSHPALGTKFTLCLPAANVEDQMESQGGPL
jgi:signal transduction histidine kinase